MLIKTVFKNHVEEQRSQSSCQDFENAAPVLEGRSLESAYVRPDSPAWSETNVTAKTKT